MTIVTKPTRKPAMGGAAGLMLALPVAVATMTPMAATALPSACDAVSGNLVANCGFETTTDWSVIDRFGFAHTGTGYTRIGFQPTTVATQQSIATQAGQTYNLSFFASNVFSFGLAVYFGGQKVNDYAPGAGYAQYTASVTASATSSILRFERTGSFGYGLIDDVVLLATQAPSTDVPEPASLAVLGAGLAGLAGLGRRRRRKA